MMKKASRRQIRRPSPPDPQPSTPVWWGETPGGPQRTQSPGTPNSRSARSCNLHPQKKSDEIRLPRTARHNIDTEEAEEIVLAVGK
jgi:hypothetical protein